MILLMKKTLITAAFAATTALSAQSFVAGWDFDNVGQTSTSMIANWGDLSGSAVLSWSHATGTGPPTFLPQEYGVDLGFNSDVVGNTFAFLDPNTGFDQFSDGVNAAEQGFKSLTSDDSFTFSFDATNYTGLTLTYAFDADGELGSGDFVSSGSIDLSSFDGDGAAIFVLNTANGALYDNFAITGTVVPEPSTYAALLGIIALAFAVSRRRK